MFENQILSATFHQKSHALYTTVFAVILHASIVTLLVVMPMFFHQVVRGDMGDVLAFLQTSSPILIPPSPPRMTSKPSEAMTPTESSRVEINLKPGTVYAPREISDTIPPPNDPGFLQKLFDEGSCDPDNLRGVPWGVVDGIETGLPRDAGNLYTRGTPDIAPPAQPEKPEMIQHRPMSSSLLTAKLIKRVEPVYPRIAIEAQVQGIVILQIVIGSTGRVEQVKIISGKPLLVPAAVNAVKQWVYSPTILNGEPISVVGTVTVRFRLRK